MQDDRATAELRNSERAARSTSTALPAVHVRTARWQAGRSRAWRLLMFAVLSALLVCLNAPARRAVLHNQQSQQEISRARARLACPSLCTHACERQSHIRMDITRMQTHTHTHTHTHIRGEGRVRRQQFCGFARPMVRKVQTTWRRIHASGTRTCCGLVDLVLFLHKATVKAGAC